MGILTPSEAKGKPFFEGASSFRNHDDQSDNFISGAYSHLEIEFSATECDELVSWMMYANLVLAGGSAGAVGAAAFKIRNETGAPLLKGTLLAVSGYSSGQSRLLVVKADATDPTKPPLLVLAEDLADSTNGTGYGFAAVSGLDTSGAASVGDPVFLDPAVPGAFAYADPSGAAQLSQEIGRISAKDAATGSIQFYPGSRAVRRYGTPWLQNLAVTAAKVYQADNWALGGSFAWPADITPAVIGAHQNDYNPAGLSTAEVLRLNASAAYNITGLAGGADGRILVLHNVGSNTITLKDEDVGSIAANRFALPADVEIKQDEAIPIQYDSTSLRWRALGKAAAISHALLSATHTDALAGTVVRGDLIVGNSTPQWARLPLGSAGQRIKSDGTDAVYADEIISLNFVIDGGGATILTGEKGHIRLGFAGTIQRVTLLADQSGSAVVDIWKDNYTNFPPTNADSICAAAKPTLAAAQKYEDGTLTGWTTAIAADDILAFNVDSCATIQRLTLELKIKKG